jgi:hypothetical protein
VWIIEFLTKITKMKKKKVIRKEFKDPQIKSNRIIYILLGSILIFSILIVSLPHFHLINQDNKIVSVDTANYGYTVRELTSGKNLWDSFYQSFFIQFGTHPNAASSDRPLSLFFIVLLSKLIPIDVDYLIDVIIPMILSPILVISVFLVVKEFTDNIIVALISAFLTSISPQVLTGVYAGLFANWLALAISFFSFYLLLKYLKSSKYQYLVLLIFLLILSRFTHFYTWIVMAPIMITFTAFFLLHENKMPSNMRIRKAIILSITFVIPFAIGVGLQSISMEVMQSKEISTYTSIVRGISLDNFPNYWHNLDYSLNIQNGGVLANSIILILCIGWIFLFKKFPMLSTLISIILLFSSISIFFGNDIIQTRILYNIPFQIPAAVTLYYLLGITPIGRLLFISIILCLITISLRFVSNLILNV